MTNGTPHIQPNGVKIAKTVLMPGDPCVLNILQIIFRECGTIQ